MSEIKKRVAVIILTLAIIISGGILFGCASHSSPYTGTWRASTVIINGCEQAAEPALGGAFSIRNAADGSCNIAMGEQHAQCEWKETDSGFHTTATVEGKENGYDIVLSDKVNEATLNIDGMTFKFIRK